MSKDKKEATMRQEEGHSHVKIKFHTHQVGDPQTGEQEYQTCPHTVVKFLGPTSDSNLGIQQRNWESPENLTLKDSGI